MEVRNVSISCRVYNNDGEDAHSVRKDTVAASKDQWEVKNDGAPTKNTLGGAHGRLGGAGDGSVNQERRQPSSGRLPGNWLRVQPRPVYSLLLPPRGGQLPPHRNAHTCARVCVRVSPRSEGLLPASWSWEGLAVAQHGADAAEITGAGPAGHTPRSSPVGTDRKSASQLLLTPSCSLWVGTATPVHTLTGVA